MVGIDPVFSAQIKHFSLLVRFHHGTRCYERLIVLTAKQVWGKMHQDGLTLFLFLLSYQASASEWTDDEPSK